MKLSWTRMFLGLGLLFAAISSSANAEETQLVANWINQGEIATSYDAAMEDPAEAPSVAPPKAYSNCGGDPCCTTSCRSGKFTAGFELALLRPHMSSLSIGGQPILNDFNTEISPRFYVGYENADGFGGRLRYWNFDHESKQGGVFGAAIFRNLEVNVLDLEATQSADFCWWSLEVFGGTRIVNHKLGLSVPVVGINGNLEFQGFGPTVGGEARRPLGGTDLSVFVNGRASFLYGDTELNGPNVGAANVRLDGEMMQVWETQMGVEYNRGSAFARLALEAQAWELGIGLLPDIGYFGPTFAIGIRR